MANRKRVSVKQFIAAMRKNGYKQARQSYIKYAQDEKTVIAACAFGQAGLNLGVSPGDLHNWYSDFITEHSKDKRTPYPEWPNIVTMNDYRGNTLAEIADAVEASAKEHKLLGARLGDVRIMNDLD